MTAVPDDLIDDDGQGDRDESPPPIGIDADETVVAIGSRIRAVRVGHELTLQTVATRTGLSTSMLSMVERGRTSPSIGTLVAIASALGVGMADLFEVDHVDDPSPVLRRADQALFETASGVHRRIAVTDRSKGLELVENEYQPGTSSGDAPVHHGGVEYGIVLDGVLSVELTGVTYDLGPGDVIAYDSSEPHRIVNNGDQPVRAIWVNLDRS